MDTPETARGEWLRDHLPNMKDDDAKFTSMNTWDYNCVGYAVGDYNWWQHENIRESYWPPNVKRDGFAHNYVEALKTVRFEVCDSGEYESEYEKIAIYHKGGKFKHVALQLSDVLWGSKLGEYEDIEHRFSEIEGGSYGKIYCYMKRERGHRDPLPDEYRL